jgi:hypothetical protein
MAPTTTTVSAQTTLNINLVLRDRQACYEK